MHHRSISAVLALGLALAPLAAPSPGRAAPGPAAPSAYAGPKKTVSVDVVGAPEAMGVATTNEALIAMFTEALNNDGRFIVVERSALAGVQSEQQLAQTNAPAGESGAKAGQLMGANILVRATVTKFEANAGGGGVQLGGVPGMGLGRFTPSANVNGQHALVEISLRLIDTTSGQVIGTAKAEGKAASRKIDVGVTDQRTGATLGTSAFKTTPLGQAAQTAIAAAVEKIALGASNVPWSAQIVDADNGQAYVSAGASQNLAAGTVLHVFHKTKTLTDPSTGAVLEVLMDDIGSLQIQEVHEKVSIAKMISGSAARGDIVKLQ